MELAGYGEVIGSESVATRERFGVARDHSEDDETGAGMTQVDLGEPTQSVKTPTGGMAFIFDFNLNSYFDRLLWMPHQRTLRAASTSLGLVFSPLVLQRERDL
ncbi:unnamed protein product [Cyclocybe aegerita]|uniref:Uncharacterized protein n=1 Tax=Cyclocybe aegerita TaxID=1973307 RepID=A0A8S0WFX7_CYCAE|nr:unnamed protein product [Cyclocybe aegerita]